MFGWRWETDNSELSLTGRHQRLPKPKLGRHDKVPDQDALGVVGKQSISPTNVTPSKPFRLDHRHYVRLLGAAPVFDVPVFGVPAVEDALAFDVVGER